MKNLGIPYAVGYILAGLVVLPLLLLLVNKVFFQGNDAEKYIQDYLGNMENLKVHISPDQEIVSAYERYTAYLSKGDGIIHIRTKTFYSNEYDKHFQFRMVNIGDNFYSAFYNHIEKNGFIITVNKDDMNNSKMGTKENPVPVFRVVGDEKPVRLWHTGEDGETVYENYDITKIQYENSIYCHLKYVMPKEEFKEQFEKEK
ncbi:hypothetical protein [Sinomicrobium weinanense]|uniref:DUF8188 domain-containing protein n=1 Tax=Sinomicrobium weinanense TaxID=2842200 RepID=A0A926JPN5_9FLAO|nr:hypothetical protein [Sinomicrobium weinanense]MBC9795076.1 hypothetical protein [Sinomicrobium weinanense]MBU3123795.1 hypothetical protein [Sinomicrobium weinanense]